MQIASNMGRSAFVCLFITMDIRTTLRPVRYRHPQAVDVASLLHWLNFDQVHKLFSLNIRQLHNDYITLKSNRTLALIPY